MNHHEGRFGRGPPLAELGVYLRGPAVFASDHLGQLGRSWSEDKVPTDCTGGSAKLKELGHDQSFDFKESAGLLATLRGCWGLVRLLEKASALTFGWRCCNSLSFRNRLLPLFRT